MKRSTNRTRLPRETAIGSAGWQIISGQPSSHLVLSYANHVESTGNGGSVSSRLVDDWMKSSRCCYAAAFKFSPRDDTSTDTNLFRAPLSLFRLVADIHITFIIIKSVRPRQSIMKHLLASFLRSQSSPPH